MSQDQKKSTVGDPIWVESLLTPEEHAECHRKYPSTVTRSKPVQFDPNYHLGGKWRAGMGKGYTTTEITQINNNLENLHNLLRTKKFQRRPEYGPENEMKP